MLSRLRLLLPLLALPLSLRAAPADDLPAAQRLVRVADAAMKSGRFAEARQAYAAAALEAPAIGDWLLLRVAGVSADSVSRDSLYQQLTLPAARAHIEETEAAARERAGDLTGAARWYWAAGRWTDAARIRLADARTPAARDQVRAALIDALDDPPAGQAAPLIDLLLQPATGLTSAQALLLARIARAQGQAGQAVQLYPRAFAGKRGTTSDHLRYALALGQLRRHREARAALLRISARDSLAPVARYWRAVFENRLGLGASANREVSALLKQSIPDSLRARALFLSGDIAWRAGQDSAARVRWNELLRRFPASDSAARAGFLTALVRYESGDAAGAAREWQEVLHRYTGSEALAAGYWGGRAWLAAAAPDSARALWHAVIARDSQGYYAVASAERLGQAPWSPPPAPDQFLQLPDVAAALARIGMLRTLELASEMDWERDWLTGNGRSSAERLLAMADGFRKDGQTLVAAGLARRALRAGAAADARVYRLLYPLPWGPELRDVAEQSDVDPLLAAALIRQESAWEPAARSRVGAMGLMQVMPATGRQIARALKLGGWKSDDLLDPATNLRFGTHYLGQILRAQNGSTVRALAAYNAGPSRVSAWATGAAADDPELLLERIVFPETRDYVRLVQRNLAIYRALYGRAGS